MAGGGWRWSAVTLHLRVMDTQHSAKAGSCILESRPSELLLKRRADMSPPVLQDPPSPPPDSPHLLDFVIQLDYRAPNSKAAGWSDELGGNTMQVLSPPPR